MRFYQLRGWTGRSALAFLLVLGCGPGGDAGRKGVETGSTGETGGGNCYPDADGDGHGAPGTMADSTADCVASSDDCDDGDAAVYPGASEVCDGVDNDCNGVADGADAVNPTTWSLDTDGDGYGADTDPTTACDAPEGYSAAGGDCDDTNPAVYPGAPEICDGIDDDCDGVSDGSDATGTWYRDADGDSYGDADSTASGAGCEVPAGYVENDADCDDTDAAISPDAEDACDNDVDEDCSGSARDCGLWTSTDLLDAYAVFRGDTDTHNVGDALAAGDVNGDGVQDLWISGPALLPDATLPTAAFLVIEPVAGVTQLRDAASATLSSDGVEVQSGFGLSNANDLDGDGYDDIAVTVEGATGTYNNWLCVVMGPVSGALSLEAGCDTRWLADADTDNWEFDDTLAAGEDTDGDGELDGLSGSLYYKVGRENVGGAALLPLGDLAGDLTFGAVSVLLTGDEDIDYFGSAVAQVPDTTGDGIADILVGAEGKTASGIYSGAAYLADDVLAAGLYVASDAAHVLAGVASGDAAGDNVAGVGDLNGDGYGDFAVGARGASPFALAGGAVYVFYGPVGDRDSLSEADAILGGPDAYQYTTAVAGDADLDADGTPDLVIGAHSPGADSPPGTVYLVHGPPTGGTWSLAEADATWTGEGAEDMAGYRVALVGDTNADGYADILAGAPFQNEVDDWAGAAYLLHGGPF